MPLSPNWWLRTGSDPVAVKLIAEDGMNEPRFEIVKGAKVKSAIPDVGTITRGVGRSPWTGETIDGDYIKTEAQAGRMGQLLYAVVIKAKGGLSFAHRTIQDSKQWLDAELAFAEKKNNWIANEVLPSESFPEGNDNRPLIYGMPSWIDFFSPRQLLAMGIFAETRREVCLALQKEHDVERASAVHDLSWVDA